MTKDTPASMPVICLTLAQWQSFLGSLYERDERLERKGPDGLGSSGSVISKHEEVDAFVLSGHVEALQSAEIDGDLWGTLEDIEAQADDEDSAWAKICAFYAARDCVLLRVTDAPEREEWIMNLGLWERLRPEA